MEYARYAGLALRVQHRHSDGTWGSLDPVPARHDPSAHDPEREWATATIYRCTTCDEEVQVAPIEDPGEAHS